MRVCFLLLASSLYPVIAQETTLAPAFKDVFYGLDAGNLRPLESQAANFRVKVRGFIVMNAKGTLEVSGGKSPVRFPSGASLEFIVRPTADPLTGYCLRNLDSKTNVREIVLSSEHVSPLGAQLSANASQGVIPITVSPYGNDSYKMTANNLPPGEYALSRTGGRSLFCFGVDASGRSSPAPITTLTIESNPGGAEVLIDTKSFGTTPVTTSLPPGSKYIVLKKDGFENWTKELNAQPGAVAVNAEMKKVQESSFVVVVGAK